jgi:spermidine synthase
VPASTPPLSPALRRFLYGTAALTGAAILIVEILGAKLLSPYVGTSHFVWTAQIAVTLLSLAAGYWLGGWLVDRSQDLRRLYGCILIAGIYLAVTVPFVGKLAFACLAFPLALGSLLASLFLFFVPLTLLATVGPFVIRVLTSHVGAVGGTVGRLSAVSTLGSVLGTILVGYVLVPILPNSVTMWITAGVLMAVAVLYFAVWRRTAGGFVALLALTMVLGWFALRSQARPWPDELRELATYNSNFGLLQVFEDGERRYFLNDYLQQNTYDPIAKQSTSLFTYSLYGLARVHAPRLDDVLCIGLGIGMVPMQFARDGARVTAVEINPDVIPMARAHFDFDPTQMRVFVGDGRQFLNTATEHYDVVILDAFLGDSAPTHLMSREAFAAIRRVLRPDGVLVINSLGDLESGHDFLTASLDRTLRAVFGATSIRATGNGNVFHVATPATELREHRAFDFATVHPELRDKVRAMFAAVRYADPAHGLVLTDDFNPVDFHDAANREEMRRRLVGWMHPVLPF